MKLGLAPIEWTHARILILGSLPGDQSLRMQQYYANPRNHFWTILATIFDSDIGATWDSRLSFLESHDIALWDVLHSAERDGSLDGRIRNPRVNDFASIVERMPILRTLVLNGGKAASLFDRHGRSMMTTASLDRLRVLKMPSTSPVPGRSVLTLDAKIEKWRAIVD